MVSSYVAGVAVAEAVALAPLTTLRVGPVAPRVLTCTSTDQLIDVLRAVAEPILVLAGGSNVVLADDLADTMPDLTVVRVANIAVTVEGNLLRAEAGAVFDDVVVASLQHGLGGLECLSGIPGSVGATPVQNVGAYGAEVADTISRVRLLDRCTGEVRWAAPEELKFGYRTSILKHSDAVIVLEVEFALDDTGRSAPLRYRELANVLGVEPGERADPLRVRQAVLQLRAGKGMVLDEHDHDTWSVGSFFTNPVVSQDEFERVQATFRAAAGPQAPPVPHYPAPDGVKLAAGWLVEHAGFGKGYPGEGAPARLSTKHALALTNRGEANSADVIALAREVQAGVLDRFGIALQPEPILIGCDLSVP
ncbi:UDP-N-acetylenolpyruvoylglucosamine reductase [Mycolicibacterium conceptionense]|uniref:UDP-N-acetylenolpyruvoylglucosamine reductase n=1 Tax=Mycolicibacterium conceptionense TaxID=451644 RepID=A0A1A1X833_9MYCO|nr:MULTISPECIES: UDP-N-acetylmuramate dehydrogenase [Mycolicibacterium]MCW1820296.1 UDP-N-acetylmuramate dehydrogenase [Mycolicibacterium senegalense]OBB09815.1 UDP-N-acetylenolpyruvoylglucosamine reductase [Mycolicibacterium conceptionense]OBE97036.1 UDP-N-acetylenolpyruvoylglucosamine reductase [Mycolicibacterium conceptionense]OBF15318.1 UDP-N-acetylenolpyruvoylglucosamine reductase [Mycolicibacterium conceptionense]OBF34781.1 UDP-N-acetylenolpyruvoylglucosamine reductase [Mycolicibacterium